MSRWRCSRRSAIYPASSAGRSDDGADRVLGRRRGNVVVHPTLGELSAQTNLMNTVKTDQQSKLVLILSNSLMLMPAILINYTGIFPAN